MRISAISPQRLSRYVSPILAGSRVKKKEGVKRKKISKSALLEDSLENLESALTPVEELESGLENPVQDQRVPEPELVQEPVKMSVYIPNMETVQKEEPVRDPGPPLVLDESDTDLEEEMAMARFDQAKVANTPIEVSPFTIPMALTHVEPVSGFGLKLDDVGGLKRIDQDKFSYFTLIEAILIYNILYKKFPEDRLKISFGLHRIRKMKKELESTLLIYRKKDIIKKYTIIYDIQKSFYTIYDTLSKKKVGEVNFDLDKAHYYLEEAQGKIEGKRLLLDPVWDKKDSSKMRYQTLQIGHRRLDLTSTSKSHRQGQWSFTPSEQPVSFDEIIMSSLQKKSHIVTKKNLTIGKTELRLSLRFFDDMFAEPYAGSGEIKVFY